MARALGSPVTVTTKPTVNPLVYCVEITFSESLPHKVMLPLWNVAQQWMAKNDAGPSGKADLSPTMLRFNVAVKQRKGLPKNNTP